MIEVVVRLNYISYMVKLDKSGYSGEGLIKVYVDEETAYQL